MMSFTGEVRTGFGQFGILDTQGNDSGYGSEPGYRGDAEFGYGDEFDEEEDDSRLLFWGEQVGEDEADDLGRCETTLKAKETQRVQQEVKASKYQIEAVIQEFEDHLRIASADQYNSLIKKSESAIASIVEAQKPTDDNIINRPDSGSYSPQFGEQVHVKGLGDKLATVVEASSDDETILVQYGKIRFRVKKINVRAIPSRKVTSTIRFVRPLNTRVSFVSENLVL